MPPPKHHLNLIKPKPTTHGRHFNLLDPDFFYLGLHQVILHHGYCLYTPGFLKITIHLLFPNKLISLVKLKKQEKLHGLSLYLDPHQKKNKINH